MSVYVPIPDDWDGESWTFRVVCWPDSVQWRAILSGLVSTPSRGRYWDGKTGDIRATQLVGLEILARYDAVCDDIVTVLEEIRDKIDDINETMSDIEIHNEVTATASQAQAQAQIQLSGALAIAESHSEAIVSNVINIETSVFVSSTCPPCSVTTPPPVSRQPETGVTDTPRSSAICDVAEGNVDAAIEVLEILRRITLYLRTVGLDAAAGLVASAIEGAAHRYGLSFLLPPSGLVQMAEALRRASIDNVLNAAIVDALNALKVNRSALICELYDKANGNLPTDEIMESFAELLETLGMPYGASMQLIMSMFNLNTLALLYYDGASTVFGPATFDCDTCSPPGG